MIEYHQTSPLNASIETSAVTFLNWGTHILYHTLTHQAYQTPFIHLIN